jgi:hypothetical protein
MGFEYRLKFSEPSWYRENRDRLAEYIRSFASLTEELPTGEFRLRDDSQPNSWSYDLRIFLKLERVELEVSSTTSTSMVDLPAMLRWIRRETPVDLVDDDGIPCEPFAVEKK